VTAGQAHQVVRSFDRGLAVLRAFRDRPALRLVEVAAAAGVSRAVARRTLATLETLGYVQADAGQFRLRPRVLELGWTATSWVRLPDAVGPHLDALARQVDEWCAVTVLDGAETVFVATRSGGRAMRPVSPLGRRTPAHPTSMGQVLLAALPPERLDRYLATAARSRFTPRTLTGPSELRDRLDAVRARGHAVVDEEYEAGLCDLAVPLRREDGTVLAALNVSVQSSRVTGGLVADLVTALRACAAGMRDDLTWLPPLGPAPSHRPVPVQVPRPR
jgi:IclR family transcriptional regulator, pca regulon regulatory protein